MVGYSVYVGKESRCDNGGGIVDTKRRGELRAAIVLFLSGSRNTIDGGLGVTDFDPF